MVDGTTLTNPYVHRSCEVKLRELINAPEISLRAMDNRKNYQPEYSTWFVSSIQCFVVIVMTDVPVRT